MTLMNDNKPHCDHPQLSCLKPSENWFVSPHTWELYVFQVQPHSRREILIPLILSVKDQCLVLFPYTAQNEDELSLVEGQVRLVCSCHLR